MISIDQNLVRSIIKSLDDQFTTADVLRRYIGHFHKDKGAPVWISFNVQFGKYLSNCRDELRIESIEETTVLDDNGEETTAMMWRKALKR